jgi:hypothetical protein
LEAGPPGSCFFAGPWWRHWSVHSRRRLFSNGETSLSFVRQAASLSQSVANSSQSHHCRLAACSTVSVICCSISLHHGTRA